MALTQIRGNTQIKAGTILDAQISASAAIATSKLADGANFLKRDGSVALTGNLNANSNKIVNLLDPTADQDAATKKYVDDAVAAVDLSGVLYADGSVPLTGDLDADGNKIINLLNPSSPQDAATKDYVDDLDAENLKHDGSVPLSGDLDANGNKIIGLAAPSAADDAATKAYVDSVAAGFTQLKYSVRAATTANITLANEQTIDGVALVDGDRVLVKNQTAGEDNGIYLVVDGGAWTRSADLDEPAELTAGIFTFVEEGTANGDTGWILVTDNPIVLGTDPQVWSQFSDTGSIVAGNGLTKTGNTLDVVSANAAIVANANDIALTLDSDSLEISGSGLRIKYGSAGQVVLADAGGKPIAQTLAGDVSSVSGAGSVTLAATIARRADFVTNEIPAGDIDGLNDEFVLDFSPVAGSEQVFLNGMLLLVAEDYTISGDTITLLSVPESGDRILVSYRK